MNSQRKRAEQHERRARAGTRWRNTRSPPGTGSAILRGSLLQGIVVLAISLLGYGAVSAAQEPLLQPRYSIKPSEVVLPEGVALGQYRRVIRPFANWTLICDENLKKKQRVCNITQTIVDERGALAFSWSLAGTSDGKPIMIIRVPASVGKGNPVQLSFSSQKNPVNAKVEDCDQTVCVVLQPVGPAFREQISKQADVRISYADPAKGDGPVVIGTTLKGLPPALAAIK